MSYDVRSGSVRFGAAAAFSLVSTATLLGGCFGREELPYHVVHATEHGVPRSIFVDPVGYRYPDLVQRTRVYDALPLPESRNPVIRGRTAPPKAAAPATFITPAGVPVKSAASNAAVPPAPTKQSVLRPARERFTDTRRVATDAPGPASAAAAGGTAADSITTPIVEVVPSAANRPLADARR